jgi:hypothetical protein
MAQPIQQEGGIGRLMGRMNGGGCNMLIYRTFLAIAAATLGAAVVMALPGFSPAVEAGTSAPMIKTDRLDYRPLGSECTERAWPYYGANCLLDRSQVAGQARTVRLVTTDRLPQ